MEVANDLIIISNTAVLWPIPASQCCQFSPKVSTAMPSKQPLPTATVTQRSPTLQWLLSLAQLVTQAELRCYSALVYWPKLCCYRYHYPAKLFHKRSAIVSFWRHSSMLYLQKYFPRKICLPFPLSPFSSVVVHVPWKVLFLDWTSAPFTQSPEMFLQDWTVAPYIIDFT